MHGLDRRAEIYRRGIEARGPAAPVFARSDAIGTVMRRKLEPITTPLLAELAVLRGAGR